MNMKKALSLILVFAMLACMIPAVSSVTARAPSPERGLTATFWGSTADAGESGHYDSYKNIMGSGTDKFDESIEQLIKVSDKKGTITGCTTFGQGSGRDGYGAATGGSVTSDYNEYMVNWKGTVTATTAGTYQFVLKGVDDCVAIFVDDQKVFERWGNDGYIGETTIDTDYTFTMTAGETKTFEMWFLDILGGELLNMAARRDGGDVKSFDELGLSFATDADYYRAVIKWDEHDDITSKLPYGYAPDGRQVGIEGLGNSNGAKADDPGNHNYSADNLTAIKSVMRELGTCTVPNYETGSFYYGNKFGMINDDALVEYNGYVTPAITGTYLFGSRKVDNCMMIEITDPDTSITTTVFEFWAKSVWNDNSVTYYNDSIELTAGKSYQIHAVFLEIDGGECFETRVKINGTECNLASSLLRFTKTPYMAGAAEAAANFVAVNSSWRIMTATNNLKAAGDSWNTDSAVYGAETWRDANAPFGTRAANSTNAWGTSDAAPADGSQADAWIWAVKEFTVEDASVFDNVALMCTMYFDDHITLYINGVPVFMNTGFNDGYDVFKLADNAGALLKDGTNTVAARLNQNWGGYEFDLSLFATNGVTDTTEAQFTTFRKISTPEDLIALSNDINDLADANVTRKWCVYLANDINMSGKAWTPINRFIGIFDGNFNTISDLSYIVAETTGNIGLLINELANNHANGTLANLTLSSASLMVENTTGFVGGIVGLVDRGRVENCTFIDSTVIGTAVAGGIAGIAEWQTDGDYVIVRDCSVIGSLVKADEKAAGIVGTQHDYYTGKQLLGNVSVINSTIEAKVTVPTINDPKNAPNVGTVDVTGSVFYSEIKTDGNNSFYYQTRTSTAAPNAIDIRVIAVVDEEWIKTQENVDAVISVSDGTVTKTITQTPTKAYSSVMATGDNYSDVYVAEDGDLIYGWIITGVPSGYTITSAVFASEID